jgi:hypothetical protein
MRKRNPAFLEQAPNSETLFSKTKPSQNSRRFVILQITGTTSLKAISWKGRSFACTSVAAAPSPICVVSSAVAPASNETVARLTDPR